MRINRTNFILDPHSAGALWAARIPFREAQLTPMLAPMEPGLTVYRHDSPGGRIVIITVDERNPNDVVARLQVERRTDPERQGVGEPPLIAEARGTSREAVLAELRALAADDAELARRLARWTAMQRRPRSDTR
jgi:hypothetical protein